MTNQSDQPTNVGSNEELDAGGSDDARFEAWLECHEIQVPPGVTPLPMYFVQDMRAAYLAGMKEARDGVASKLIDVWIANHGERIGWARAVNIIAIVQKMPDAERDRLLALDAVGGGI